MDWTETGWTKTGRTPPCTSSDHHSTNVLGSLMGAHNIPPIMPRYASLSDSRDHIFRTGPSKYYPGFARLWHELAWRASQVMCFV